MIIKDKTIYGIKQIKSPTLDGDYEFPYIGNIEIENRKSINLISYKQLGKQIKSSSKNGFIHFFMDDKFFQHVIDKPEKYIDKFRKFGGVIPPDISVYADMTLGEQIYSVGQSRSIAHFFESYDIPVIPNVRWGDRSSYKFVFDGVRKNHIIAVGSHGTIKKKQDKVIFCEGFEEMMRRLTPRTIIIYGTLPNEIREKYGKHTEFIVFESEFAKSRKAV